MQKWKDKETDIDKKDEEEDKEDRDDQQGEGERERKEGEGRAKREGTGKWKGMEQEKENEEEKKKRERRIRGRGGRNRKKRRRVGGNTDIETVVPCGCTVQVTKLERHLCSCRQCSPQWMRLCVRQEFVPGDRASFQRGASSVARRKARRKRRGFSDMQSHCFRGLETTAEACTAGEDTHGPKQKRDAPGVAWLLQHEPRWRTRW